MGANMSVGGKVFTPRIKLVETYLVLLPGARNMQALLLLIVFHLSSDNQCVAFLPSHTTNLVLPQMKSRIL